MMSSEAVLISPTELAELLRSDQPSVVADVRWNLGGPPGKPEFVASHIPGAVWVDLETQLAGPPGVGGRHPLPTVAIFEQAMRDIGVCQDSLVVAYDAANSQAASRLWWLLTDADTVASGSSMAVSPPGGQPGCRQSQAPVRRQQRGDFVARPGQRPQLDAAEISARLGRPDAPTLVDVRTAERYSGGERANRPGCGPHPGSDQPALEVECATPTAGSCHQTKIARLYAEAVGADGGGALLRLRDHRRAQPAGAGVCRADGRSLPRLMERLDQRPKPPDCYWNRSRGLSA